MFLFPHVHRIDWLGMSPQEAVDILNFYRGVMRDIGERQAAVLAHPEAACAAAAASQLGF